MCGRKRISAWARSEMKEDCSRHIVTGCGTTYSKVGYDQRKKVIW